MNNWFECKVKYEKTLETGTQKKVTEAYLVDAMTFTDAEARIIEEMTPFISGEFEVTAVKKARISELFQDPDGDKWYRCKVMFITLDEKSGLEKKSASTMLVRLWPRGERGERRTINKRPPLYNNPWSRRI